MQSADQVFDPKHQEVLHTRMLLVEKSIGPSLASISVLVALAAWFNRGQMPASWLAAWVGAAWLIGAWRYACARHILANPPPVNEADMMLRKMAWRAVPGGLFLAATSVLFFRPSEPATLLLLSVVPILAFAGQVAATAPPIRVLVTLIAPGVLVLAGLCLWEGTDFTRFFAVVVLLFSTALLRIARNISAALDNQASLTIRNRQLAAERDTQWHRAEAASLAKSRLFAAAGHDLRTPVIALNLFLTQFDDESLSAQNRQLIGAVRQSSQGLVKMLDGVRDFSLLDAGNIEPVWSAFAVQTLLDDIERDFGASAHAKGLVLRTVPSRAVVITDSQLLGRIARNLVSNALRYTAQGGVLVAVRVRQTGWVLAVWDTGRGIAESELPSIFDEFSRGAQAKACEPVGLGLGLAIVQRFAVALGARVEVRSQLGRGTVFRVRLKSPDPRSSKVNTFTKTGTP